MLKRRHKNSGKANTMRRNAAHLAWVRGHRCVACQSDRNIEAAHIRVGTDGGTGMKPNDMWTIPLCRACHAEQHRIGEWSFAVKWRLDVLKIATELAGKSPHLVRLKRETANDE